MLSEKRKFERIRQVDDGIKNVVVSWESEEQAECRLECTIENISANGIGVCSDGQVPVDTAVTIRMQRQAGLAGSHQIITIRGRVRNVKPAGSGFRIGVVIDGHENMDARKQWEKLIKHKRAIFL